MQNLWNQYNLEWCNFQCKICETNTILYDVAFNAKFVKPIVLYDVTFNAKFVKPIQSYVI
jgi:hypothetical protein